MSELALFPGALAELTTESPQADLHRQLDGLHQMIYRRGGIRPVNAAIEELAKLLLMELKLAEDPTCEVPGVGALHELLDPDRIAVSDDVVAVKDAFRYVASLPEYAGRLPAGGSQPIWPEDEPLRISRPDVVAEAIRILRAQVRSVDKGQFDVIGTAFDIFLRGRYDHAGGLGTHLTPHTVASSLARICATDLDVLAQPFDGPIVGDPCCGTGRFLIAAVNELAADADDPRRQDLIERGLFGADQSASSVAKARLNLLLLGGRRPNVFTVSDSIVDPHVDALRGQLRLVLTNPPFGDGKYDSEAGIERAAAAFETLAGKRRIDPALAFVARCLELLADGGRLGIVLPDGLVDGPVLRRGLLGAESVRICDVSVEANISLPTATFALAGTVARTSALVLRKQAAQRSHIFVARAEHVGYLKQGSASVPDPKGDDLPAIADAATKVLSRSVVDAAAGVRFICRSPLAALIPARDATTLDPARVDPDAVSARDSLRAAGTSFRAMLQPVKRRQCKANGTLPFVSVLHIDDLGAVAWHEARAYRPSTPGLEARPNEIIFSLLNPRKLRATVIPTDVGSVFCSSEFGVFESVGDPYEKLVLLHHPLVRAQLVPLGRGTSSSRRRITPEDLLDVLVPRLSTIQLASYATNVRDSLDALRRASISAADAYAAGGQSWAQAGEDAAGLEPDSN
jgi:type I restriction enzyme M protein